MFQKVYFLKHPKYCSDFLGYKDTGEINRNGKVFYGKMISNKGGLTIFEFSCDESRKLFLEKCFKWLDTPELEVLVVELGQDNNNISTTLVEMLGVLAEI